MHRRPAPCFSSRSFANADDGEIGTRYAWVSLMDRRTAPTLPPRRRLAASINPMVASVVGALFPMPRRLAPIRRPIDPRFAVRRR